MNHHRRTMFAMGRYGAENVFTRAMMEAALAAPLRVRTLSNVQRFRVTRSPPVVAAAPAIRVHPLFSPFSQQRHAVPAAVVPRLPPVPVLRYSESEPAVIPVVVSTSPPERQEVVTAAPVFKEPVHFFDDDDEPHPDVDELAALDSLIGGGSDDIVSGDKERLYAKFPIADGGMRLTVHTTKDTPATTPMTPRGSPTITWIVHKPLNSCTRQFLKPHEALPVFDNIRARLSIRSQARLRLKCRAHALKVLEMLEHPQQNRFALAAFLTELGHLRYRKIWKWVPELHQPMLLFIKVAMR
jgi:hypothetical protein